MAEYVPSPVKWVREQVELYEGSGGTEGTELMETGLPVIIVTHRGNRTGSVRKTPLMRVKDGESYVLVASMGGAPKNPVWGLQPARRCRRGDPRQDRGDAHARAGSRGRRGARSHLGAVRGGVSAV